LTFTATWIQPDGNLTAASGGGGARLDAQLAEEVGQRLEDLLLVQVGSAAAGHVGVEVAGGGGEGQHEKQKGGEELHRTKNKHDQKILKKQQFVSPLAL
jgi:hypothetical protein